MTQHLIFDTPGQIDLRAFTTFGINAKPNTDNPIGYFGTGLKYAVAILCRLGGQVTVEVGSKTYVFYSKATNFRDKQFDMIRMKSRGDMLSRWRYEQLPYTTEFGKNWEPWQVFRELESNTRDENGHTYLVDDEDPHGMSALNEEHDRTRIIVTDPQVIQAYREIDTIFLPPDLERRDNPGYVEIYNQPTTHVYFRGLRVMDLDKPAMYTYNFTGPMDLTEDRTLKYPFMAKYYIVRHLMQSTDKPLIEAVLDMDEKKQWEGGLEFDTVDEPAGATFVAAVGERKYKDLPLPGRVGIYYDRYHTTVKRDSFTDIRLRDSQWRRIAEIMDHLDYDEAADALGWTQDHHDDWKKLRDTIQSETEETQHDEDQPF